MEKITFACHKMIYRTRWNKKHNLQDTERICGTAKHSYEIQSQSEQTGFTLKRKCLHFDEIFIIGCTKSCQNDNFRCSQWWKFHQNDDIFVSVQLPFPTAHMSIYENQSVIAKQPSWLESTHSTELIGIIFLQTVDLLMKLDDLPNARNENIEIISLKPFYMFYWRGLNIILNWANNPMPSKVWNEVTYILSNLFGNGFSSYKGCTYLPMPGYMHQFDGAIWRHRSCSILIDWFFYLPAWRAPTKSNAHLAGTLRSGNGLLPDGTKPLPEPMLN